MGDITHLCSWNACAMKNHYLLQQIADLFRRLYELEYLMKHEIAKTQRKISSDFLHSLSQPAENEDTFPPNKAKVMALCWLHYSKGRWCLQVKNESLAFEGIQKSKGSFCLKYSGNKMSHIKYRLFPLSCQAHEVYLSELDFGIDTWQASYFML